MKITWNILENQNKNPVVLFLHGFMGSSGDWQTFLHHLPLSWNYLTLDLPGHGNSVLPLRREYFSFDGTVQWLDHFFTRTGIFPHVIMGYSMGGRIAMGYALRYPDRVRGLLLESASPGIPDPASRLERQRWDDEMAKQLRQIPYASFLEKWYRLPVFAHLPETVRQQLVQKRLSSQHPYRLSFSLRHAGTGRMPYLGETLLHWKGFLGFLAGEWDEKYLRTGLWLKQHRPETRLAICPKAGHVVHLENPAFFLQTISAWLEEIRQHYL